MIIVIVILNKAHQLVDIITDIHMTTTNTLSLCIVMSSDNMSPFTVLP